jgi:hypothetical protein
MRENVDDLAVEEVEDVDDEERPHQEPGRRRSAGRRVYACHNLLLASVSGPLQDLVV